MIIPRLIPIPSSKCKGFTILDADGDYNVYINANLSYTAQVEGYEHEMKHIKNGDFERISVQEIEAEAHRKE